MSLMRCKSCTTLFAVGLLRCPHCAAMSHLYAKPNETEDEMPKSTVHSGATNAAADEDVEVEVEAAALPEVEVEAVEEEAVPTNAEVRAWAKANDVPVSDKGVVAASVVEQYLLAQAAAE